MRVDVCVCVYVFCYRVYSRVDVHEYIIYTI